MGQVTSLLSAVTCARVILCRALLLGSRWELRPVTDSLSEVVSIICAYFNVTFEM